MDKNEIPYQSKYVGVYNSTMHYLEAGEGKPILFLHGNPASSYIWRWIIPVVKSSGRCIAPDLIGMGESGKPKINYRFEDHYNYLEEFIGKLGLSAITLVLHDWGSALGFYYASRHPDNIHRIVFMESLVRPWRYKDLHLKYRLGFRFLRMPVAGEFLIYGLNAFLNFILPALTIKRLEKKVMKQYKKPFRNLNSRKPMLQWPREIPIDGKPGDVYQVVNKYKKFLQNSELPKLLLYGEPGAVIDNETRKWCEREFKNMQSIFLGKGFHFLQEDYPLDIGKEIVKFLKSNSSHTVN